MPPLLEIKGLQTFFYTKKGIVKALDDVSFTLAAGDTLGVVGESGCGKTVLALSILRLVPDPPGRIVAGEVIFNGTDLLLLNPQEMRSIRGGAISMIFQEPMTSLNPVFTIGDQVGEVLAVHASVTKREVREQIVELLARVGISSPERRLDEYPHQLSGGMRQRVMIAMALACRPLLMLADEPTTALDVTIQAQILALINRLQHENKTAVIMVTHDLGVVAESAQHIAVMYAGKIVEQAPVDDMFSKPLHPYTIGLLESIPSVGMKATTDLLKPIPGQVPSLYDLPSGCAFAERCFQVMDVCRHKMPDLLSGGAGHLVRCWKYV